MGFKLTSEAWSATEDEQLRQGISDFGPDQWLLIARMFHNPIRFPSECISRWQVLHPTCRVKKNWTPEEDRQLRQAVNQNGCHDWTVVSSSVPERDRKQCRERWHNQLSPDVKNDPWTRAEDQQLSALQKQHGSQWARIATELPGRSGNAVKNRWHGTHPRQGNKQSVMHYADFLSICNSS